MPKFTGTYEETFTVDGPVERVAAHFASLDSVVGAYADLEHSEKLDEKTLRFRLEPKSALGNTFVGKYDCRYELSDKNVLTWRTVNKDANIVTEGRAEFSSVGEAKTRVRYHEEMTCDIPINRLLGKALAPIVERDIAKGVKSYLERMRKSLPR